jgi:DNA-binding response OmpR family regulator
MLVPGLSGPELQERLSELGSTVPVIFLTGHPDVPTTVRAIKAGADDFLVKPVSSDELLQAVERAIAHHEVTRGLKSKLDMVHAHIAALTPRQRQVFELVIRGNTNNLRIGAVETRSNPGRLRSQNTGLVSRIGSDSNRPFPRVRGDHAALISPIRRATPSHLSDRACRSLQ